MIPDHHIHHTHECVWGQADNQDHRGTIALATQPAACESPPGSQDPTTAAITTGVIALVPLCRRRVGQRMEYRKSTRQLCRALLMLQGTISLHRSDLISRKAGRSRTGLPSCLCVRQAVVGGICRGVGNLARGCSGAEPCHDPQDPERV